MTPFALAQRNLTQPSVTAQTHAANKSQAAANGAIIGMPAVSANPDAVMPVTDQSLLPRDVPPNRPAWQLPKASSGPGVRPILIKPIPKFPEVVLYDQLDNPGAASTGSQEFPDMPDFTDFTADDFFVPGGQSWQVTEVYVQGVYFNGTGPANNFNVFFYQDSGGLPGTQVYTRIAQPYVDSGGVFEVSLTVPVTFTSGIYWVSVQAHMPFDPNGQWGWTDRMAQTNSPAVWQNPAGGFGTCSTWELRTTCVGDPGAPDQMFRLIGTVGPPPTPTATPRSRPTPRPHSTPAPRPNP
ncbi:MAG TPA: hypothetical protein VFH87_01005 [Candidatus Udaeobacter sp.]|nr:hypothetical protein [Candidatus Udaeobacter sp.]